MNPREQVASKIKTLFPKLEIQHFPYRKERMHLLVANPDSGEKIRVRVSESKNYLNDSKVVSDSIRPYLSYSGWWTFNPIEIEETSADLWILIHPGDNEPARTLLLTFSELNHILTTGCTTRPDGQKDFYWYASEKGSNFAARPLGTEGAKNILEGKATLDPDLNLDDYVDSWDIYFSTVSLSTSRLTSLYWVAFKHFFQHTDKASIATQLGEFLLKQSQLGTGRLTPVISPDILALQGSVQLPEDLDWKQARNDYLTDKYLK